MKKFVIKIANSLKDIEVIADSFDAFEGFFIFKEAGKNIAAFKSDNIQSITSSEMILTLGDTYNPLFGGNAFVTCKNPVRKYSDNLNIS